MKPLYISLIVISVIILLFLIIGIPLIVVYQLPTQIPTYEPTQTPTPTPTPTSTPTSTPTPTPIPVYTLVNDKTKIYTLSGYNPSGQIASLRPKNGSDELNLKACFDKCNSLNDCKYILRIKNNTTTDCIFYSNEIQLPPDNVYDGYGSYHLSIYSK